MRRERGVALVTALLVVAIAVSVAVGMSLRDQAQIHRAALVLQHDRAHAVLRGAEISLRRALEQWADLERLPWEACISPSLQLVIDDVEVSAIIENMHCRFNLNSLGRAERPPLNVFADLVSRADTGAGIAPRQAEQLATAVRDWLDPATDDPVYRLRTPPERSGNRPFSLSSEFARVQGVTPEIFAGLAPYLAALPGTDNVIDLQHAPEALRSAASLEPREDGGVRYFRLALSTRLDARDYFQCALLDAPNGDLVLREATPCEP
jgi:general secretion pathway protein K